MFLEGHFPFLHPFVTWTFKFFLGVLAASVIYWFVFAPGVCVAKEIYEAVIDPRASKVEIRLTQIWAGFAGFLLVLLLGGGVALIFLGSLRDVKLWFIGICWTLLFIPWCIVGFLGRKAIRRFSPPAESDSSQMRNEVENDA